MREFRVGNVGLLHLLRVGIRSFTVALQRRLGRMAYVPFEHPNSAPKRAKKPVARPTLNLQPGELVRVRSREEIAETLERGLTRGLWFDWEMIPYLRRNVPRTRPGRPVHR